MQYHITRQIEQPWATTVSRLAEALQAEGFGIVTETDMQAKFKEKLNADFRRYTIFGACNPKIAFEAVQLEDKLGVFLPCNILVQEMDNDKTEVTAINPMASIGAIDNAKLEPLAAEVGERLKKAIERI